MSSNNPKGQRLPVTVFSGFLGSGKTTLLDRVLNNHDGRRMAAIVNNLSEHSFDTRLLNGASLKHHKNII